MMQRSQIKSTRPHSANECIAHPKSVVQDLQLKCSIDEMRIQDILTSRSASR